MGEALMSFLSTHSDVTAVINYNPGCETFVIGLNSTRKNSFRKAVLEVEKGMTEKEVKRKLSNIYGQWIDAIDLSMKG